MVGSHQIQDPDPFTTGTRILDPEFDARVSRSFPETASFQGHSKLLQSLQQPALTFYMGDFDPSNMHERIQKQDRLVAHDHFFVRCKVFCSLGSRTHDLLREVI